jgi:hypothetical protein
MLADSPSFRRDQESVKATLAKWRDVSPALDMLIARSPILFEAKQLPRDLSEIGSVGLEALSYFATETVPPAGWREAKLATLERAAKPKAEVEFVIINPIRKLIIVAAQMAELKNIPRTEWKTRVQTLTMEETRKGGS